MQLERPDSHVPAAVAFAAVLNEWLDPKMPRSLLMVIYYLVRQPLRCPYNESEHRNGKMIDV